MAVDVSLYFARLGFIMIGSTEREDRAFKKAFGEEWERWVERTPYTLIPYMY